MGGDRDNHYPPRRDGYAPDPGYRPAPPTGPPPPERYAPPPPREEYASDQVKDLLELYFRDPQAFDQYAKTYYYGERMERARAVQERRPPDAAYVPPVVGLIYWQLQQLLSFSLHLSCALISFIIIFQSLPAQCLQCFDAVGWVAGRASSL